MTLQQERSEYAWPAPEDRQVIGKRTPRIDGVMKATGVAKYSYDMNPEGLLHAKLLTSPHAHANITVFDPEPARTVAGVREIYLFPEGKEGAQLRFEGQLIAAVVADTPEQAEDGVRAIKIEYEKLPFWVDDEDLEGATQAEMARQLGNDETGDPDTAFKEADVVVEGDYGIPVITHCCWETHGTTCVFDGKSLTAYLSTQNVSGTPGQFTSGLNMKGVAVDSTEVVCQFIGGGFGSKFGADAWGVAAAYLAQQTGRPVKLMLDRTTELQIAGSRPSGFAHVRVGAKKDGTITAWDSHHWGTNGLGGGGVTLRVLPYVFQVPNFRRRQSGIRTNTGGARAWRAPNHPQACALTQTALDDLAAALGMDSLELFRKNIGSIVPDDAEEGDPVSHRRDIYLKEMEIAADLIGWKDKWRPRGKGGDGAVKQGLGLALHTWGGGPHASNCLLKIHPDGGVETFLGSQDLGTGTKTVIALVIAETLGLPVEAVKVHVGRSSYPTSGGSGGSTTVGGVSNSNRTAAIEARKKLFAKVAPKLNAQPEQLEAVGGRVRVKGDSDRSMTWKQATALLGVQPLEQSTEHPGRPVKGLTSSQVGGVQMAHVSVDTDTGVVRMNKFVAVQDVGAIVDLLTAESQVYGAAIMGIAYSLYEHQIMDNATGRFINSDMTTYKLPRLADVGEIVVHMIQPEDGDVGRKEYDRGTVGLGEPPVISPGTAISNAVANAIGVRVPVLPLTPEKVLAALEKGGKA
jgi:xanthine dehydrogenase YagR molybdenum-binding subunit